MVYLMVKLETFFLLLERQRYFPNAINVQLKTTQAVGEGLNPLTPFPLLQNVLSSFFIFIFF